MREKHFYFFQRLIRGKGGPVSQEIIFSDLTYTSCKESVIHNELFIMSENYYQFKLFQINSDGLRVSLGCYESLESVLPCCLRFSYTNVPSPYRLVQPNFHGFRTSRINGPAENNNSMKGVFCFYTQSVGLFPLYIVTNIYSETHQICWINLQLATCNIDVY